METIPTLTVKLNPQQVKITYLTPTGDRLTDPNEISRNYLWDVEFVGVDINPQLVRCVRFPDLRYDQEGLYYVEVDYIDPVWAEERKIIPMLSRMGPKV